MGGSLLCLLIGCEEAPPVPEGLPDQVLFRTAERSFNSRWFFALDQGRIWVKEREQGEWELLGRTGLPEGWGVDSPLAIEQISSDGVHLTALSTDGFFFRGTNMQRDLRRSVTWHQSWGWPMARGPGLSADIDLVDWAVSDSHPSNVDHMTDSRGQEHSVGMGVAHLYALDGEGLIRLNDWWLPADWSRRVCGPERGAVPLAGLSASGSTLFVVGRSGELYTRLYDLDTSGENELLTYSYVDPDERALPAEPWSLQPSPEGAVTSLLTIFQTGEGNAARTLRIEGQQQGRSGYFEKELLDPDWSFVETGQPLSGPLLEPTPWLDLDEGGLSLSLGRQESDEELQLELEGWSLFCSPSRVLFGEVELELHLVHVMVEEQRELDYWEQGAPVRGALLLPEGPVPDDLLPFLGPQGVVNLIGQAGPDSLELTQIERGDRYHVPRQEKGRDGELVLLRSP